MNETRKPLSREKQEEIMDNLRHSRIVDNLPVFLIKRIVAMAEVVNVNQGDAIIKEGDDISSVYFIIKGSVGFYFSGEHIFSLRRTGDIFGEMSAVSRRPYPATVKAETYCELIRLNDKEMTPETTESEPSEFDMESIDTVEDMLFRFFTALLTDKLNFIIQKSKELRNSS